MAGSAAGGLPQQQASVAASVEGERQGRLKLRNGATNQKEFHAIQSWPSGVTKDSREIDRLATVDKERGT